MRSVLLAVIVGLLTVAVGGDLRAAEVLDRTTFLQRVRSSHPGLRALTARVEVARARTVGAGVAPNPRLGYGREEVFHAGESWPEDLVELEWPVEISGQRGIRVESAEAGLAAEEAVAERARLLMEVRALEEFEDAVHARLVLNTLKAWRPPLAAALAEVRARAELGETAEYDATRLSMEVTTHDDLILEASSELRQREIRVAVLAGEAAGLVRVTEAMPLAGLPEGVDELTERALSRADMRSARLRGEAARKRGHAAARGWVPTPVLRGGFKAVDLGPATAFGYVVGVGLELPFFEHGQAEAAAADAEEATALAEVELLARSIPAEVRAARAALGSRVAQAQEFEDRQLPRLEGALRAAERAYREGERPVGELLDAYRAAREAELRAVHLRWKARKAELALWAAVGRVEER